MENNKKTKEETIKLELAEKAVSGFLSAFYVQYIFHKKLKFDSLNNLSFLSDELDTKLFASQRIFVKHLISDDGYKKLVDELSFILNGSLGTSENPVAWFSSRVNKDYLFKQLFWDDDGLLSFVKEFGLAGIKSLDFKALNKKVWLMSSEQQVVVLSKLFGMINDEFDGQIKTIRHSLDEHIARAKEISNKKPGFFDETSLSNLNKLEQLLLC